MRDADGLHKIGVTECAIGRRYLVEVQLPKRRHPVRLVRAVEVSRWDAYGIEARIHRLLGAYRCPPDDAGRKEWFAASMRRCNTALSACLVD